MPDLLRSVIDASLPTGALWRPAPGGGFDRLLDGMAKNHQDVYDFLGGLSGVRDPRVTTMVSELEAEYGLPDGAQLTDDVRRSRLISAIYHRGNGGTWQDLQDALLASGFPVQVHANDPAVDPAALIDQQFSIQAGEPNAVAGNSAAFAKRAGGFVLANGDVYTTRNNFTVGAGSGVYAGAGVTAGEYDGLVVEKIVYALPSEQGDFSSLFFVGGDKTIDTGGHIVNVEAAYIQSSRRSEFETLILRYKPIDTWGLLIVVYT